MRKHGAIQSDVPTIYHYTNSSRTPFSATLRWDVVDDDGNVVAKTIRQIVCVDGKWQTSGLGGGRPLYHLHEFLVTADTVYVAEGEKAVSAMESFGLVATTSQGGSAAAAKTDWSPLAGKRVVIVPDFDDPGRKYKDKVIELIQEQAPTASIEVADLADCWAEIGEKDDVYDWSEAHDSKPPEWFQGELERISKPVEVKPEPEQPELEFDEAPSTLPEQPEPWNIRSVWDAVRDPAPMREVIIEGLARRGEVMNIVASTKVGKSWMAAGLLFSVATGMPWLGRKTTKGRALLLDNELHDETIANRMRSVANAMRVPIEAENDNAPLDYVSLRGQTVSIADIQYQLSKFKRGDLSMVVLDAKYRFFGHLDENNNAAQTDFHNTIDRLAKELDCVIVLIHHASKGDQSGKSVTDIGSGGGAQSRAVDAHLTIRPHAEADNLAVLDAAVRTFAPVESATVSWSFPIWSIDENILPSVKQIGTRNDDRSEQSRKTKAVTILQTLEREPGHTASENKLSNSHPGQTSFRAAIQELQEDGRITWEPDFRPSRSHIPTGGWRLTSPIDQKIGEVVGRSNGEVKNCSF